MRRILFVFFMILATITSPAVADAARILVDASKDGGIWWSPQGPSTGFDQSQPHQGKALADLMRDLDWDLVELARGATITVDLLRGFDVIIKPPHFFQYAPQEVDAYEEAVSSGARLLLMASPGKDDPLAALFGVYFAERTSIGETVWWDQEKTLWIEKSQGSFTAASQLPVEAVVLASASTDGFEDAIFGYIPYFNGHVFFLGLSPLKLAKKPALLAEILDFMASPSTIKHPTTQSLFHDFDGPPAPILYEPAHGALLPQPKDGAWNFQWKALPGARAYQIMVVGAKAMIPLVSASTSDTKYVIPRSTSYIMDRHRLNWSWRVRALEDSGTYGPWSVQQTFDVMPMGDSDAATSNGR